MSRESFSSDWTEDDWQEWYLLTPQERWRQSMKLWEFYLSIGGRLDPEPDSQSPFDADRDPDPEPPHDSPIIRIIPRGGT